MRLLDTETGQFAERDPEKRRVRERTVYAILSHTWDAKEQTYGELRDIQRHYEAHTSEGHQSRPNVPEAVRNSALSMPHPLRGLGRLAQSEVEALFRTLIEKYDLLPNPPQSCPSVPEGVPPPGEQDAVQPSSSSPLSEQSPPDYPLATASLIPRYERSNSCFTRGMARLKTWIRCHSAFNARQSPNASLSATTPHRIALGRQPVLENDRDGPSPTLPPSQLVNNSETPLIILHPPPAIGRHTQSEVEALFHAFVNTYDFTNPAPAPALNHPLASVPTLDGQSKFLSQSIWEDPELSPKIRDACRMARENGYRYIWIDSCCIDKSSSSELSEAINSMYKWYRLAAVCYAYLSDVPPGEDHRAKGSAFHRSRWFTRGWTLQELIAPHRVEFLSDDWAPIASKHALVDLVENVTNINEKALLHLEPLDAFSVAQRLSWAAEREMTREEDRAYSLLGIFNINMPTLYGEGDRAFRRLQEQIMQQIPDQSLFAWGLLPPSSGFSYESTITDAPISLHAVVQDIPQFQGLFATSPDFFRGCEAISTSRQDSIQIPSSPGPHHKIAYTSTPYGICTQLQMIPLTEDLLLHVIPHSEDVQLDLSHSPEGSQWYLAILAACQYREHEGHRWGRVCSVTPPTSEANVESVLTGYISIQSQQGNVLGFSNLFLLSPDTIMHYRPHTKLKTVYIPHPDRAVLLSNPRHQPYAAINLVLLRETRNALCSRGYSADLRHPNPSNPTTHCLMLSNDEHTINVRFRHTLKNGGRRFTMNAEVKMSGPHVQSDSTLSADQVAGHRAVSWSDYAWPWLTKIGHKRVRLSVEGSGTLILDLRLDFAGSGYYILRVNIFSDVLPAFSAIKLAGDQAEERERTEEGSPSRAIDTEDAGREDPKEADGHETASAEARDETQLLPAMVGYGDGVLT